MRAASALRLLQDLAFYRFVPDSLTEPFQPTLMMGGGRSATPDDLTDDNLAMLRQLAPDIEDAEMRARVSDTIWVRKRDAQGRNRCLPGIGAPSRAAASEGRRPGATRILC